MPRPEKHVFICTQARPAGHPRGSCAQKACAQVHEAFFNQLQERNLFDRIRVTASGCLGPCGMGPNVLVYPDGIMYGNVSAADVVTIVDEHLLNNRPLTHLMLPANLW